MAPNRLILDTDGGVDDAQALLLLIANGRAPHAITTVFGNVTWTRRRGTCSPCLPSPARPSTVHAGAAQPLAQDSDPRPPCPWRGWAGRRAASRPDRRGRRLGRRRIPGHRRCRPRRPAADPVDLLMIGPLTNLALALRRAPGIVGGIGRLTIMGGTVYGRGNITPAAEFNIFSDPEAAAIVFAAAHRHDGRSLGALRLAHFLSGAEIDRMFAPVPASDYKAFAQALVEHERKGTSRNGQGDLPVLHRSTGGRRRRRARHGRRNRCAPPSRSRSRRASPAA